MTPGRLIRALFMLLFATLLFAWPLTSWGSGNPPPAISQAKRHDLERTLEAQMELFKVPGAIVGLWFPSIGSWVTGAGQGDLATGRAPDIGDKVRIGSVTKTFTATVVLQLIDEGRLSLDDKLSAWEPEVPGAADITVRQLLDMTSGLFNFTDDPGFWQRFMEAPKGVWTPQDLVDIAAARPAAFPPGQKYQYCNTNYILLGMIIEKLIGRTAGEEITTRIIERLGLENTSFPSDPELPYPFTHGYVPAAGQPSGSADLEDLSEYSPSPFWTAGGMVSTLADLRIWIKAIATGELLSPLMHAEQLKFSSPDTALYGLGMMNWSNMLFGHSGEVPGYNSSMYYMPSLDAVSIVLINRYPSSVEGAADMINDALITAMATNSSAGYAYPDPADFGALSWTEAFKAAHEKLSREYAFGDWKGVDWPGLSTRYLPKIEDAQAAGDMKAYYLALHEYLCSIPDGHLSLASDDPSIPEAIGKDLVGGCFGLAAAELDDGRLIAAALVPGGGAEQAGIATGAELLSWGGLPVSEAISRIDPGALPYKRLSGAAGNESPIATLERLRLEQCRLLTRGPIGSLIEVEYGNPGAIDTHFATLEATDDGGRGFSLVNFAARPELSDKIDWKILPEGYGYVLVRMEHDLSNPGYPERLYDQFSKAIASFVAADLPGLILDLRGNYGGSDQLSADICGFFSASPAFYEKQEYYDKRSGGFLPITLDEKGPEPFVDSIVIEPQTPHFAGPVAILINPGTTSSGEGPALCLGRLPNAAVIGFHGTNGSFGMVGGEIGLPGGFSFGYPFGRSVDEDSVVQLDSRNGSGGVQPSLRVPATMDNVLAFAAGTDVELAYAVTWLRSWNQGR
ncbi:MAG: class A beta-lactamase-related serine hydrolase [Spirochaetes bacterium]|nr:class A beta-lactamase-related serine hydrolase [Spirochaetota bacterium]